MSSEQNNEITVNSSTDFTTSKLVDYLNDKYESKKTGEPFTLGDIQQYLRRGYLPKNYGHHPIQRIEDDNTGLKFIRVDFSKTIKELKAES